MDHRGSLGLGPKIRRSSTLVVGGQKLELERKFLAFTRGNKDVEVRNIAYMLKGKL